MATQGLSVFKPVNAYSGKVLVKCDPSWDSPTWLLRLVTRTGDEMLMTVSGEAYESFRSVEVNRIYDFKIPGRCVRHNVSGQKHGITSEREVVLKYACKYSLGAEGWPTQVKFNIVSFQNLTQQTPGSWIDIYATVTEIFGKQRKEAEETRRRTNDPNLEDSASGSS